MPCLVLHAGRQDCCPRCRRSFPSRRTSCSFRGAAQRAAPAIRPLRVGPGASLEQRESSTTWTSPAASYPFDSVTPTRVIAQADFVGLGPSGCAVNPTVYGPYAGIPSMLKTIACCTSPRAPVRARAQRTSPIIAAPSPRLACPPASLLFSPAARRSATGACSTRPAEQPHAGTWAHCRRIDEQADPPELCHQDQRSGTRCTPRRSSWRSCCISSRLFASRLASEHGFSFGCSHGLSRLSLFLHVFLLALVPFSTPTSPSPTYFCRRVCFSRRRCVGSGGGSGVLAVEHRRRRPAPVLHCFCLRCSLACARPIPSSQSNDLNEQRETSTTNEMLETSVTVERKRITSKTDEKINREGALGQGRGALARDSWFLFSCQGIGAGNEKQGQRIGGKDNGGNTRKRNQDGCQLSLIIP